MTLLEDCIGEVARLTCFWDGLRGATIFCPNFVRPFASPDETPAVLAEQLL